MRRLAGLIVMAMLAMLVVASSASAEFLYRGVVAGPSTVDSPRRVAVEQSTGNAFVVEEAHDRVLVFGPQGMSAAPLTELGVGVLDAPFGIAIEESGGQTSIYVSDAGNNRIVRFLSDEQPTPTFTLDATYTSPAQGTEADEVESFASPLALAPDGDLWVADRGANVVKRFDATGAHVAGANVDGSTSPEGAFTGLLDLAVNSGGDLYVVDSTGGELGKSEGTSRVQRFAESGAYKATLGPLGARSRSAIVAVNPANDSVLVSGDQDDISNGSHLPRFYLFDNSDTFVEEIVGSGDFWQGAAYRGIAFAPDMRNLFYFAGGKNWYFFEEAGEWQEAAGTPGVHAMSEALPPTLAVDPATGVTSDAATIGGEVNPNGIPTEWQVEYKRAAAAEWQKSSPRSAGAGTDPVAVSEELQDLLPGVEYEARLAASSADGTVESSIVSFTTDTAAPAIVSQTVTAGAERATLRARINPGGEETTYHFEWGPTAAYGQSTPAETIPAGSLGVNVSAEITGLTPGTTYHFRVVAENASGVGNGPDRTFTTLAGEADICPNAQYRSGAEAHLSDCRAYELVTPVGGQADLRMAGGPATPDGRVVCFNTEDTLVDSVPNGIKTIDDGFCAKREADGWKTEWATGPEPQRKIYARGANVYYLSDDGERVVFASDAPILSPDFLPPPGSGSGWALRSYLWDGSETRELTPPPPPLVIPGVGEFYLPDGEERRTVAVDANVERGLFLSTLGIVPTDTNSAMDVYEWNPDGVRLVSSNDAGEAAGGVVGREWFEQVTAAPGSLSDDGARVFFEHLGEPLDEDAEAAEAPEAVTSVYLREGDEMTLVSPRRGSGPDADVDFMGASSDGGTAYLETTQQLTSEPKQSGRAIYGYDVAGGALDLVVDAVGGVHLLGISEDGSTVVYREQASNRAFVLRGGDTSLLGTLDGSDLFLPYRLGSDRADQRALRITADGSVVVFASAGEFAGSTGGVTQIYRWSAEDGIENVSDAGPSSPTRNASIGAYSSLFPGDPREAVLHNHRNKAMDGRVISDDGSRVFFETPEALVERDVNGVTDVYEWHDGDVDLVSPGTDGGRSLYHESSADGKTVFFTTFNRVVPEFDRNDNRDLYVAQPGGGFPPPPAPPSCAGEACQPGRAAPEASRPGSQPGGDGNVLPGPEIAAFGKKQLRQLKSKGRTRVSVAVAMPGRVTVLLKAKLGGRAKTVAKASKTAKAAGKVVITLSLSKAARKQLRRQGKLRLTLEARHSQSDQTARKAVMLRD